MMTEEAMSTRPWEQYVEQATEALRDAGFVDLEDDTMCTFGDHPVALWVKADNASRAALAAVGPLIAGSVRKQAAEEIAEAIERVVNDSLAGMADINGDRAAAIAREVGSMALIPSGEVEMTPENMNHLGTFDLATGVLSRVDGREAAALAGIAPCDTRPTVGHAWTTDTDRDGASAAERRADAASQAVCDLLVAHPDADLTSIRLQVTDTRPDTYTVTATARIPEDHHLRAFDPPCPVDCEQAWCGEACSHPDHESGGGRS